MVRYMGAPGSQKREQLRTRDGDECWWCFKAMDFSPQARATQVPTIEHLEPKSLGGSNLIDNLALCHPGCNKQLANRSRAEKERLRERRMRRLERKTPTLPLPASLIFAPRVAKTAAAKLPARVAVKSDLAGPVGAPLTEDAPGISPQALPAPSPDWQRIAILAVASATFCAGLCLGLLING